MDRSIILLFITFVTLISHVKGDALAERRRIAKLCQNGTTVADDVLENLVKNDYVNVDPTPQNTCFARCVAQSFNFTKEDGDYNRDHIVQNAPTALKTKFADYMDACKEEVGVDACQTAFKKNRCFFVKLDEGKGFFTKVGDWFKNIF